jgi:hypothetical protein
LKALHSIAAALLVSFLCAPEVFSGDRYSPPPPPPTPPTPRPYSRPVDPVQPVRPRPSEIYHNDGPQRVSEFGPRNRGQAPLRNTANPLADFGRVEDILRQVLAREQSQREEQQAADYRDKLAREQSMHASDLFNLTKHQDFQNLLKHQDATQKEERATEVHQKGVQASERAAEMHQQAAQASERAASNLIGPKPTVEGSGLTIERKPLQAGKLVAPISTTASKAELDAAREFYPRHKGEVGTLLVEGRQPMRIKKTKESAVQPLKVAPKWEDCGPTTTIEWRLRSKERS